MLGGILLRLAATTGSSVDFWSSMWKSESERDFEDCDIFETEGEEEGWVLDWDKITPIERINVMAKIIAAVELHKDFMVFAMMSFGHEWVTCHIYTEFWSCICNVLVIYKYLHYIFSFVAN